MPSSSTCPSSSQDAPHRAVDAVRDLDRVRGGDAGGLGRRRQRNAGCRCAGRPVCARKYRPPRPFLRCKVERGSKGCSSSHDMLGMTSVPLRPQGSLSAAISPAGPPSTGLTFEKAQWTSSTPPGCTPRAWSWAISWVGETGWAGMRNHITAPTRVGIAVGAKRRAFKKSKALSRNRGRASSLPFQRENRAPEGEYFFGFQRALPLWKPQTRKAEETLWKSWRKTPTAAPSLWNERSFMVSSRGGCPGCAGR